ncbi:hypothetical protein [Xanthomonas phage XPV1]|uniref:dATP/dGTP diphosphohydrolase N-terminal domain-containing protein n=1 Tax=Xanthomonas phage XPV1 TaxID=2099860 RepID=A0A3S7I6C2_9CAUD|nr:hypothetical protein KEM12_gp42 [Xanthomonas phage XPV1]AVO24206.1 hypothetical protein [Xanthomonas phage XPV1]
MNESTGRKFDAGKVQPRLLFEGMPRALSALVDVLTFGAGKYDAHNWLNVANGIERYQDASYRHDSLRCRGELCDAETGLRHRAHHIVNELFVLELELRAVEESLATPVVSTPAPAPEPEPEPSGEREILGWRILMDGFVSVFNATNWGATHVGGISAPPGWGTPYLFATREAAESVLDKLISISAIGTRVGYTVVPVYKETAA